MPLISGNSDVYAVDLLAAAITGLDFFTRLAQQPADLQTICKRFGIQERPADVMLTLFSAMELIRQRNGVFELTENAREFLAKGSYWYIGAYFAAMQERPVCKDMLNVLRTGKPANWASYKDEKEWTRAMEDEKFARGFTAAMDCRGRYLAHALAKVLDLRNTKRLLDIAGGSGIYARTLAEANTQLLATILEKPPVDKIAREGATDRVDVVVADMFRDPLPSGYDAHLFSNVLHDWDVPVVEQLSFEVKVRRGNLAVLRLGELGFAPRPVFDLLLRYAVSEDGALHAEKYYRTVSEEFAATRAPFRRMRTIRSRQPHGVLRFLFFVFLRPHRRWPEHR